MKNILWAVAFLFLVSELFFRIPLRRRSDYVVTFWYRIVAALCLPGLWWFSTLYFTRAAIEVGDEVRHQFIFGSLAIFALAGHISGGVLGLLSFDIHESLRLIFANAKGHASEEDSVGVATIMGVWRKRLKELAIIGAAIGAICGACAIIVVRLFSNWAVVWTSTALNLHFIGALAGALGVFLACVFVQLYTALLWGSSVR